MRVTVLTVILSLTLAGCSVLSGEPNRDVYELLPRDDAPLRCGRGQSTELVVELPKARTTLDSDRIMIRPSSLQVAYLPDARWGDTVPTTLQMLLIRSFGRYDFFNHVGTAPLALAGDYALLSTINDFNADAFGDQTLVRLSVEAQLVRESDARVVARGRFQAQQYASTTKAPDLVTAFEAAAGELVDAMTAWGLAALGVDRAACRPASSLR